MNLNVGCGYDEWGDVRLDISRFYHRRKVKLNVCGDAQNLPFRDKAFEKTKALHILEHLPNWKATIREWCRVTSKEVEIEVPVDPGFVNRQIYTEILSLTIRSLYNLRILPRRRREHLWKFKPQVIASELKKQGFEAQFELKTIPFVKVLSHGRKSELLPFKILSRKLRIKFAYKTVGRAVNEG